MKKSNDKFIYEIIKDNKYIINKNGKIYKYFKKFNTNKIKKNLVYLGLSSSGYNVIFYKGKKIPVHRIIYSKFKGKIKKGFIINHKNFIKTDNRLSNLEMMTSRDNSIFNFKKNRNKSTSLSINQVIKIRKEFKINKNINDLALKYKQSKDSLN